MPSPAAVSFDCRTADTVAAALRIRAAAWVSDVFEEWTMWDKTNIRERGTSRRDVICAWLIAVAILGGLMLVTALQPTVSKPSPQQAKWAVPTNTEQAGN